MTTTGVAAPRSTLNPTANAALLFAFGTLGLGAISFLIAGFEGHGAGWEMLAIPTAASAVSALIALALGGVAVAKKRAGGLVSIALAIVGVLLGGVGFVLGA